MNTRITENQRYLVNSPGYLKGNKVGG